MSFWSSGQDSGCAGITETRETAQIRATFSRGYEVARGRKARQIAPKPRNSAFLGNTMGSKKPTSKRSHKVLLEHQWLMARGRTPPNRQSFRGCPNVISFCLLMGCKGRFDGACGRLPVSLRIGKTRQIAFVARCRNANGFILKRDRICSRPLSCLVYHQNNGRWHIPPKSAMSMPRHG